MANILESRYRRLLAWYPHEHRRRFGEEMLGVLMSGAAPDQSRPRLKESVDLLWHAMWKRLGRTGAAFADTRWSAAATVVGVLGSIMLAAKHLRGPIGDWAWHLRMPEMFWSQPDLRHWAPGLVWTVVAVLAVLGWRRVAAVGALVAVGGEITGDAIRYPLNPVPVVYSFWVLLLGITVGIALMAGKPSVRIGRLRLALFGGVAAFVAASYGLEALLTRIERHGDGGALLGTYGGPSLLMIPHVRRMDIGFTAYLIYLTGFILLLVIVAKLGGPIRRRVMAILAPTAFVAIVIQTSLGGWAYSSPQFYPTPVLLDPVQWAVFIVGPLATFAMGAWIVHRADRWQELIELGRAYERSEKVDRGDLSGADSAR